jgi:hypothetical protein
MIVPIFNSMARIDRRSLRPPWMQGPAPGRCSGVVYPVEVRYSARLIFVVTLVMGTFVVKIAGGGQKLLCGCGGHVERIAHRSFLRQPRRGGAHSNGAADGHGHLCAWWMCKGFLASGR